MVTLRNVRTGQYIYVGDGFFGTVGNFFKKTIVGKAISGVVGGALKKIPGFTEAQALVKTIGGAAKKPAIQKTVAIGAGSAAAGIGAGALLAPGSSGGVAAGSALASGGYAGTMLPDVLDPSLLRQYYRAPKGYVMVRDRTTGNVMAVKRSVAIANRLWHAGRKPPISAGDWHKYQTARSVAKKLHKLASHEIRKHNRPKFQIYKETPVTAHRKVA